ncbi:CHORD protein [Novymonas esmeraldas]|uniref:CHORD protein n=1 Tax=Novymonas esmeraldas TaxID=1808958 RepID=A0AAW0ETZ1_9TRYP
MKVYCIYDGTDVDGAAVHSDVELFKLKIDIPASWREGPCERLLLFFLKALKAKRDIDVAADTVVAKCGGVYLKMQNPIAGCVSDYNDIYILHRAPDEAPVTHEGQLRCTNYGCNLYYREEDNTDESCHYHSKGPVFHDLEKYWGCCGGKKAFDWESFQKIPKCCVGRHSTANTPFAFPKEEVQNIPLSASQVAQVSSPALGTHDGKRTTGPREFEAAAFAQTEPQEIVDGKARCRNYGCTQEFVVAENTDSACRYHKSGPVFWDTYKYWKCCPDKRCLEFDDFVKIPGCCVGSHRL